MSITKEQFGQYLEEFNEVILDQLTVSNGPSRIGLDLKFLTNYTKTNPSYSYTRIDLTNETHGICLGIEFTISFHELYNVPVFYFRLIKADQLMVYNDLLLQEFSRVLGYDNVNIPDLQIEPHHIFQQPWLCPHLCQTDEFMVEFMKMNPPVNNDNLGNSSLKYLKSWFAIYGLSGLYPRLSLRPIKPR